MAHSRTIASRYSVFAGNSQISSADPEWLLALNQLRAAKRALEDSLSEYESSKKQIKQLSENKTIIDKYNTKMAELESELREVVEMIKRFENHSHSGNRKIDKGFSQGG